MWLCISITIPLAQSSSSVHIYTCFTSWFASLSCLCIHSYKKLLSPHSWSIWCVVSILNIVISASGYHKFSNLVPKCRSFLLISIRISKLSEGLIEIMWLNMISTIVEVKCHNILLLSASLFLSFSVGLFHRLMSRISQVVGNKVELYYRQIFFPVSKNHWVLIEMIPHPEALIKVYIYWRVAFGLVQWSVYSYKVPHILFGNSLYEIIWKVCWNMILIY